MQTKYNESKTTQLAAYFLQKSNGELFLLKVVKLLYITDREAFKRLGRPISFDNYVSMDHGPVLSRTYSVMNGMVPECGAWHTMISPRDDHKLRIVDESEVSFDELSEAELEIADEVFENYGHIPRFELAELTHTFPEWTNPHGSSIPIDYQSIIKAVGYDDSEVKSIMEAIEENQQLDNLLDTA